MAHPRTALTLFLHFVASPPAIRGWSVGRHKPDDIFALNPDLVRWSSGSNNSQTDGLRGGITWALDPQLCDALMPLFPEEVLPRTGGFGLWQYAMPSILRCEHLKATIRSAMHAWEAANSNVRFFEVTSLCNSAWDTPRSNLPPGNPPPLTPPAAEPSTPPSAPPLPPLNPPIPPSRPPMPPLVPGTLSPPSAPVDNSTQQIYNETITLETGASTPCDNASISCIHCSYAELIISGFKAPALDIMLAEAGSQLKLTHNIGHQGAARSPIISTGGPPLIGTSDFVKGEWLRGDYQTGVWENGFAPTAQADGQAVHTAVLELDVSPERCWWHDDDVCNALFSWQSETDIDLHAFILSVMNIVLFTGIGLASLVMLQRLYVIFQLTALAWDTDGDGVVEFSEVKQAIKVIFGGWILTLRNKWRRRFNKRAAELEIDPDAEALRERKLEWRAALYGIFIAISKVNLLQFVLLCVLLFVPGPIYFTMISPCRECTDFHLTLVTQLGMILGLRNYSRPAPPQVNASDLVLFGNGSLSPPGAPPPLYPPPPLTPQPMAPPSAPPRAPLPLNETVIVEPPTPIYVTNRTLGYNCSVPLQGVTQLDTTGADRPVAPRSVMGQSRPERSSIFNAWPRELCPTDDDADGLRFLYPECDELLPCEGPGGGPPVGAGIDPNVTESSCPRFVPTDAGYSIVDYYTPTSASNWTHPNFTWSALPLGRELPSTQCVSDEAAPRGALSTGFFRVCLLTYQGLLFPVVLLLLSKLVCRLCLMMPWMTRTRKRNEKLQRTAAKRKAEVRRMTDGGQEFVIKRKAKTTGQGSEAEGYAKLNQDQKTTQRTLQAVCPKQPLCSHVASFRFTHIQDPGQDRAQEDCS